MMDLRQSTTVPVEDKSRDVLNAHETTSGAFMKRACAKQRGG
jgi:hypothetical protein